MLTCTETFFSDPNVVHEVMNAEVPRYKEEKGLSGRPSAKTGRGTLDEPPDQEKTSHFPTQISNYISCLLFSC